MAIKQTWRGLVSLTLFVSGTIAAITGLILYIVPAGRIANWVIWDLFGLPKEAWQAIHTLSSYLLLIFGILHVINNWRSITNYIFRKTGGLNQKRELTLAILFSVIIIASAVFRLPPLIYVMDLGEFLKESWVVSPEYEPPFGHAEELTLNAFCRRMDIDIHAAMEEFRTAGIEFSNGTERLSEIARNNHTTPMDLYMLIKKLEKPVDVAAVKSWSAEEIEAKFAGTGLGRKSIAQLAEQFQMTPEEIISKLAAAGIEADADTVVKEIMDTYDSIAAATDILKIMLLD